MNNPPNFLYRYTNVDSLRYILLPPHTIRFNPLTVMDDTTEMMSFTRDGKGLRLTDTEGQFYLISCWTDMERENQRMYEEYCRPNDCGVRIKLPVNPFSHTENMLSIDMNNIMPMIVNMTADALAYHFGREIPFDEIPQAKAKMKIENPDFYNEIAKIEDSLAHAMITCKTRDVDKLLVKMRYTDSFEKIFPVVNTIGPGLSYSIYDSFGMYKPTSWEWQQEWRYTLFITRYIKGHIKEDGSAEPYPLPFDHFDLKLDADKLQEMEITLSPYISEQARNMVFEIVRHSDMDIPVRESSLK